jgi:uncharacterized membrane protein YadS
MAAKIIFFAGLILAASGIVSPPVALLGGLIYGFSLAVPYPKQTRTASRWLLQASVVGLGFGMNLHQVVRAGGSGFVYTATGIATTMLLGLFIGRLIVVDRKVSFLINVGTAICGGSAIAAVSPIIHADDEEIAVSLGTVFVLNSIALIVFPFTGTSSVVGAAAKYGNEALAVGTTVKLARALWIVPIALVTAYMMKSKARVQWPWFILFFCLAAVANTYVPLFAPAYPILSRLGRVGLTATLYLIGTGLSMSTLKQVGARPLIQGVLLWAAVAITSLLAIRAGLIAL